MWWLPNLQVSESNNLLQAMGTKRTRGPQEIPALAIHAAKNEVVQVVGVGVNDLSEFTSMKKAELFGSKPSQGQAQDWVR